MQKTLIALEQAEVSRPTEFNGQVELQVGAPAARQWPPRVCEGFEVSLLIGPSHATMIEGRRTETPGKVPFVQMPGTFWSAPRVVGAFLSLEIAPEFFWRLVANHPGGSSLPGPSLVAVPGLMDVFWSAHRELRGPNDALARSEALLRLLRAVLAMLTGTSPDASLQSDGASKVRDAIHDCPTHTPSIQGLADLAGLTEFELLAAFRARYGVTPSRYRKALLLAQARRMLAEDRSICETAAELGFASDLGLRREFIKHFGLTPERYAQAG